MKKNEDKKNYQFETEILNPTIKEISKLENDQRIYSDKKEEYYIEDNPKILNKIHIMSVKKKEIGKIRKDLISNHLRAEEFYEENEINTDLAQKHAENYFKKRIKNFQKERKSIKENGAKSFSFIPEKPLPIKNDRKTDFESNNVQYKEKLNKSKNEENYDKNNITFRRHQVLSNEVTINKNSITKKEDKPKIESRYKRKFLNRNNTETTKKSTTVINPNQSNLKQENINLNKNRIPTSLKNTEKINDNRNEQNIPYRTFYKNINSNKAFDTEEKNPKNEKPKNLKIEQITIDKNDGNNYHRNKKHIVPERVKTEDNISSRYKKEQNIQVNKEKDNQNSKITISTTTSSSSFRRRNERK